MLTPFGASITLASSRIVACSPPLEAKVSISLPLIVSVGASVPSFDTTGLCATTSTLCEMPSIGRSITTSVDRPATTSAVTAVVTNEASKADTLYLPGGSETTLKCPLSSERICVICRSALSVTVIWAPGRLTVPCVVTTP